MPRRPPVVLALLVLLGGCSGPATPTPATSPVEVPVPATTSTSRGPCAALLRALPAELDPGIVRRPVRPVSGRTAAWGDPAVVLSCGGPTGSDRDDPFVTDGVRWAIHDVGSAQRWRTVRRSTDVELVIPDSYDNQSALIISVAGPIARILPGPVG